jgi:hypothetical protein
MTARVYVRRQTAVKAIVRTTVTTVMGTQAWDSYRAGSSGSVVLFDAMLELWLGSSRKEQILEL